MGIIADENISWRLKKLIPNWNILPSNEIKASERLSDLTIWKFAKSNNYSILTFDEDFIDLQNLYGYPPKIIWLRTGNVRTAEIASLLISQKEVIYDFIDNSEFGILELYLK